MIPTIQREERRQFQYRQSARLLRREADKQKATYLLEYLRQKYDYKRGVVARWAPVLPFFRRLLPYMPYLVMAYLLWWLV